MKNRLLSIWFLTMACVGTQSRADVDRPNVFFIAIDDLNTWVTHLGGHPQTPTPNISRLNAWLPEEEAPEWPSRES